jgi:hypothetical protein
MAKKDKNIEQEVDIVEESSTRKPVRETKASRWFRENCVNDVDDVRRICELTARKAWDSFNIGAHSGISEVYAVVFFVAFMSILEHIASKQKTFDSYSVEIFNSINIGYVNNINDDNEKRGNFTPLLEYIGTNQDVFREQADADEEDRLELEAIKQLVNRWKEMNPKKNVEYYKEIQDHAFKRLASDEFSLDLRISEIVLPLFCIFFDYIIAVLKLKFREAEGTGVSEVRLNILGLFDIFYSYNPDVDENGKVIGEIIDFEPNITTKMALKNDTTASRETH